MPDSLPLESGAVPLFLERIALSIKKIVASAGIAAGAIAALAGTAQAVPLPAPELPQIDPISKVSDLGERAGVSTLHNFGGANVEMVHDGTSLVQG